jgi:hypothetical protein
MRCKTSNFDGKYIMRVGRRGGGGRPKPKTRKEEGGQERKMNSGREEDEVEGF